MNLRPLTSRAFTLIEVVVSLALVSIVMVAIGSTILMASHALPKTDDPVLGTLTAAQTVEDICGELQNAVYITEWSSNAVRFIVPDRDGDGSMECIRYDWSGTPGDPLTRQYNDNPPIAIIDNVADFALVYSAQTAPEVYPGPMIESAEQVISTKAIATESKDFAIEKQQALAQTMTPALPANTVAWSPTRVFIKARDDGGQDDVLYVQLRQVNAAMQPTTQIIVHQAINESTFDSSYLWRLATFEQVVNLSPSESVALVLSHPVSDDSAARVEYDFDGGTQMRVSSDNTATWTSRNDSTMLHSLYGIAKSLSPDQTLNHTIAQSVQITMQPTGDAAAITTTQTLLNHPQLLSAFRELDFAANPLTVDHTGDGLDWTEAEAKLNPATVVAGEWNAPNGTAPNRTILQTQPAATFGEPTILDVLLMPISIGGTGAVVSYEVQQGGSTITPVRAVLRRTDPDAQQIDIRQVTADGVETTLATLAMAHEYVTLRMLINPALGSVAVHVDGEHLVTFNHLAVSGGQASVRLYAEAASAKFDHARVRVLPSTYANAGVASP